MKHTSVKWIGALLIGFLLLLPGCGRKGTDMMDGSAASDVSKVQSDENGGGTQTGTKQNDSAPMCGAALKEASLHAAAAEKAQDGNVLGEFAATDLDGYGVDRGFSQTIN